MGVQRAIYSDEGPRQMIVEYDVDRMDCDLIDAFYVCGLHAEPYLPDRPGLAPN